MPLHILRALGSSGLAIAVSSVIVGCGGGGGADATEAVTGSSTVSSVGSTTETSAATSTANTGDTASTVATGTTTSAGATTSDAAATTSAGTTTAATGDSASTTTAASTGTTTAASGDSATLLASADASGSMATALAATAVSSARAGVGVNLNQVSYYSPEMPTIDFMKRSSPWLTQCSTYIVKGCTTNTWDTSEESKLDLDADGWVKSLPATTSTAATYRYVTTTIVSGGTEPVGKYVVLYDGQGTITYSGNGTKVAAESTPGRDVVNVVAGTAALNLSITATTPSNYIRNIRVYAPGGACSGDLTTYVTSAAACTTGKGTYTAFENFPAGSTWFPTFLNGVKGFRTLRFMDWGQTNVNKVTDWSGRTSPTARTWSATTGVPIEWMFNLAKTVSADPWINIPPYVTDDYIHQFGKLAHANLGAGQTLNLEYGNEMWNYGFAATAWSQTQAKTAFASDLAAGVAASTLQMNWYAQRLVQACAIVKGEFGADASRVKCIANTQAANSWATNQTLLCTYAAKTLGQPCGKLIDAVAIAPYFGGYIGNTSYRPTVSSWYTDADGGLNKMFQELTGLSSSGTTAVAPLAVSTGQQSGAISQANSWMVATKAVLNTYNLPMLAYEGGQGMLPPTGDTDTTLLNLMISANRDARMGAAYQTLLQDWMAAGGQTFVIFNDVYTPSKYGMWGLRESQFDTVANAPKWKTAVQWRDNVKCWWAGC